jgi:metal-sulfur cluster biosynthetic enzyme
MAKNISEKDILNLLAMVKHPAINRTLHELGIIKDLSIKDNKVLITMTLPFPNIPIIDQLVSSIKEPIEKLGVEVEVKQTIMNQEELQAFLKMEEEGWTG